MDATDEGGRQGVFLTMESPSHTQMVAGKGIYNTSKKGGLPDYREWTRTIEDNVVLARERFWEIKN